ncbi:MAG: hypothetical protein PHC60_02020 [Heliobacteriaceae bacterium]|nr:hypothetical protein [Heliobacteriaceae bacterium]MDD4587155.1 hypothetical protein [Heliobacteriaceae bacterium]
MISGIVAALITPFIKGITALLSYISNNAFPQPLSEEEEADCLRRLQTGDEAARNTLVEHNLRLVAHIVKRM